MGIGAELLRLEAGIKAEQQKIGVELSEQRRRAEELEEENSRLRAGQVEGGPQISESPSGGSKNNEVKTEDGLKLGHKRVKSDSYAAINGGTNNKTATGPIQQLSGTLRSVQLVKSASINWDKVDHNTSRSNVQHQTIHELETDIISSVSTDDVFLSPNQVKPQSSTESFDNVVYIPTPNNSPPKTDGLWEFPENRTSTPTVTVNSNKQSHPVTSRFTTLTSGLTGEQKAQTLRRHQDPGTLDKRRMFTRSVTEQSLLQNASEKAQRLLGLLGGEPSDNTEGDKSMTDQPWDSGPITDRVVIQNASHKAQKLLGLLPGSPEQQEVTARDTKNQTVVRNVSEKAQKVLGVLPNLPEHLNDTFTGSNPDLSKSTRSPSKPKEFIQFFKTMGSSRKKRKNRQISEPGVDTNVAKMINNLDKLQNT